MRGLEPGQGLDQRHAAPAAAGHGLQQHRQRQAPHQIGQRGRVAQAGVAARHHRQPQPGRLSLGAGLATQPVDGLGTRADEDQPGGFHRTGKAGVLRQEAVAGVDGVGAGALRGGQHGVDVQVAVAGRRGAQPVRLADVAHVQRGGIGVGMHGGHRQPQPPRRARDAAGDLAAVGNQQLVQSLHGQKRNTPKRRRPGGRARRQFQQQPQRVARLQAGRAGRRPTGWRRSCRSAGSPGTSCAWVA
jgi:hypothetical protein